VPTPPKFTTPEFSALKAEWDQKLADSGFDDIERPPPCRPKGDPKRHADYHKHFIRSDNPDGRNVPLDDLLAAEDADIPPFLTRDETSLWAGPLDYLAEALHHFPFRNSKDREIASRLYEAEPWGDIKAALHVGQSRIQRVIREIKAWQPTEP